MSDVAALAIIALPLAAWAGYLFYRHWIRQRVTGRDFPPDWQLLLEKNLPVYRHMPSALQTELRQHIQWFLHTKRFQGCGGLAITDEIRLTIAATACLLLLNRRTGAYRDLKWIYVYPHGFIVNRESLDDAGVVSYHGADLAGESWSNGRIILSWDDVEKGVRDFTDGYNVVLHEFAHQLDGESGAVNGAPLFYAKGGYRSWAKTFGEEFEKLQLHSAEHRTTLLDHYGASNPAEFFAVATETFFEKPVAMQQEHAQLYRELQKYYRLDPASWYHSAR